jgi:hypothetical protein
MITRIAKCITPPVNPLIPCALIALSLGPAQAASPISEVICDTSPAMQQRLTSRLGSRREAMGLHGPEQVMELWTAPSGDWTMVVTYATGTSCIVAMGEDWQSGLSDGSPQKDPA